MLIAAVSQFILLLLPLSLSDRQRDYSSALVRASIKVTGGSLWSTDAQVSEGFCPSSIVSSLREGGLMVTDSDPDLTSPCVATETEEKRKREEAQQ